MRLLLFTALAVLLAVPSTAQPVFGVRAVGLFSTSETKGGYEPEGVLGVGASVFAEAAISPVISLVGDIGYTQSGARDDIPRTTVESPDLPGEVVEFRNRAHLLTLAPALAATLRTDDLSPYVFVGPRLDIKLAEQSRVDNESFQGDFFPQTLLGVAGGVGISSGRGRLDLRSTYLRGKALGQTALELRLGVTL